MNEFNMDDLTSCWISYKEYLLEILNGEYTVQEAKDDLRSLIGTKYDLRVNVD